MTHRPTRRRAVPGVRIGDDPLWEGRNDMALQDLGIFFAGFFGGLGVFFIGIGVLWHVSLARGPK